MNENKVELNVLGKGLWALLEIGYIIKRHNLIYKMIYYIVLVSNATNK